MKLRQILLALLIIASIYGCKKESTSNSTTPVYGCKDATSANYNPFATIDDGSCKYTGNAIFWYDSGGSNTTVNISTSTGTVSAVINGSYYYPSAPACGSAYCANFTLPTGLYSWTASSTFNTWSGTITITKNGCAKMLLH